MRTIVATATAFFLISAGTAQAEDWPTRAITMVVPYAAGGPVDTIGRILAARLSEILGQQVVIENAGGAGGMTGAARVAKSAPDGYTLVTGTTGTIVVSPLLIPNPPYQLSNFAAVGLMAVTPLVLEVPAASPHKDFRSYLAYVKANPGKVTIGHSGNGTTNHIAILELQDALKVQFKIGRAHV